MKDGFQRQSILEYMSYLTRVLSRRSLEVEGVLARKLAEARCGRPRVERRFRVKGELFRVRAYLLGSDVRLSSPSGIEVPLRIAANPAVLIDGGDVVLYVRVSSLGSHPIPNPESRTFICVGRIPLSRLKGRLRLNAKPALYPIVYVERVEDPRVLITKHGRELYHVRAIMPLKPIANTSSYVITFTSEIKEGTDVPEHMEPVRFKNPLTGEEVIIRDYRDTFPVNESIMIIRPWLEDLGLGAPLIAVREGPVVDPANIKAYPELMPSSNERKTGSNCSTRISSNEHLLIFHSVDSTYGTYHTYAAIISEDGDLIAVTPEPISTPRPNDYQGARPATLFPCGITINKEEVILTAGKDDEATLILTTTLNKIIEKMKFIAP